MNQVVEQFPFATSSLKREAVEAARCLAESGYTLLRQLSCECEDGTLVVEGEVPSYYLKQLGQTLVRDVPGVRRVVNRIRVVDPC